MADPPLLDLEFQLTQQSRGRLARRLGLIRDTVSFALSQRRVERFVIGIQKARFGTTGSRAQRSPEGVPWEPLSSVRRVSKKYGRKVNLNFSQKLVETGALRDSITFLQGKLSDAIGKGTAIATIGPSGAPLRYAGLHQEGGVNKEGFDVPDRPFLGMVQSDADQLERILATGLLAAVQGKRSRFQVRVT